MAGPLHAARDSQPIRPWQRRQASSVALASPRRILTNAAAPLSVRALCLTVRTQHRRDAHNGQATRCAYAVPSAAAIAW